jgi:hypothetical protein
MTRFQTRSNYSPRKRMHYGNVIRIIEYWNSSKSFGQYIRFEYSIVVIAL